MIFLYNGDYIEFLGRYLISGKMKCLNNLQFIVITEERYYKMGNISYIVIKPTRKWILGVENPYFQCIKNDDDPFPLNAFISVPFFVDILFG